MAFRFGKLGLDLLERHRALRFESRVYLGFGHRINPWVRHLRTGVARLKPDVVNAIVSLGVDLSSITTLANLREALVLCMRRDRERAAGGRN